MAKLNKLSVAWHGLFIPLITLINQWDPGPLKTEREYNISLVKYLRNAVPEDYTIEREYRHFGTTTDIYLSRSRLLDKDEIFIEIKLNLRAKSVYNRLVGQLEDLSPGKNPIILILIGETDESILGRLNNKYKQNEMDYYMDPKFEIILKK